MPPSVRPIRAEDKDAFLPLWQAYCAFYEADVPRAVTEGLWTRLVDPGDGAVRALVGVGEADRPLGFATLITHPGTWSLRPLGYLEDLFVDPEARGLGLGRLLIEACADLGRREGWSKLYWRTKPDNHRARAVYEKLARRSDWMHFEVMLHEG
ncbi:MAG: GNAT family N-acetyltransferase [Rhodospirillum sp.]|nr:GNAT family N-acetyltransferase [Rhodospirillum sp.]MCF8488961.1 GNAT family N-acetyltransferase [Rhodospirillum sp.]MCF8499017.1 GNAT family N-acetyltransferase [Rhodospirillum sp.]